MSVVEAAEQQRQERAERQAERKEVQRKARAYNEELGAAVLRNLMRLKIDERVLQVLIATDPLNDLGGLAMRGARYGLPGWTTTETTATGKSKVVFPSRRECATKALEFLEIATSVGELTGRMFVLIVMARYADENAVAVSSSSGWELREPRDRPWDLEIVDLIDDICATRLPDHLIEAAIVERNDLHERRRQEAKEQAAARERLDGIEERLETMSEDERAAAIRDAELVHGPYGPDIWELRQKIAAIRNRAHDAEADQTGDTDTDASAENNAARADDDSEGAPASPEDNAGDPGAEAPSAA